MRTGVNTLQLQVLLLLVVTTVTCFQPSMINIRPGHRCPAVGVKLDAADEKAAPESDLLSKYILKANEEKVRALAEQEVRFTARIEQLEQELAEVQRKLGKAEQLDENEESSTNVFVTPNKEMTLRVEAYRKFMADYIVKAQLEKARAIKDAEDRVHAQYS